jgi:hypothetical protein
MADHPRVTDLYVMQNHLGLIKVGKSNNVERRRNQLARADRCEVTIVHVIPNGGCDERAVLQVLSDHCKYGEWFSGSASTRAAVKRLTCIPQTVEWPFPEAAKEHIDSWITQLEELRQTASREKLSQRLINDLAASAHSDAGISEHYDFKIWEMIWKYDAGLDPWVFWTTDEQGNELRLAKRYTDDTPQPLPAFTSEISAALLTWPDDLRPDYWTGSAITCCVEGLVRRRERMFVRDRSYAAAYPR